MRYIFYCFLLVTGLSVFTACSNGDYIANPGTNANASVNPLHPLTASDFTWSGTNPMSGNFNGVPWVASSAAYAFDSNMNVLRGYIGNNQLVLYLTGAWRGNLYNMGYHQYNYSGIWTDSTGSYESVLGNSGGLFMLQNDSLGIKGLFYFQGIDTKGDVINITNGYFNIVY